MGAANRHGGKKELAKKSCVASSDPRFERIMANPGINSRVVFRRLHTQRHPIAIEDGTINFSKSVSMSHTTHSDTGAKTGVWVVSGILRFAG
jgi:hypothetical protein